MGVLGKERAGPAGWRWEWGEANLGIKLEPSGNLLAEKNQLGGTTCKRPGIRPGRCQLIKERGRWAGGRLMRKERDGGGGTRKGGWAEEGELGWRAREV